MSQAVTLDPKVLSDLFAAWNRSDEPGVAIGVSHPTAGVWRAAYGLASLELPVVNTTRTRMRIGSTSKMFTCLAVMLLQEAGKLSLDDPVRRHVPELPDWAEGMTLRHFMTHTSGMRCHIDLMYYTGNYARPAPADSALHFLSRQKGVNFPVGERYCYNNGGYNLLSLTVERVAGQSFASFLEERIFGPVGMVDTKVKATDDELLPNSASLHVRRADGRFERGYFGVPIAGEGAMVSTVEDMLLWLKNLREPVVGSAETWRQMKTPMRLAGGGTAGYALGIQVAEHRGVKVLHHGGGVMGGLCMALTVEALGLDVIIIANRGDRAVQGLGFDVIDAVVQDLAPMADRAAAKGAPPPPLGVYFSTDTGSPLEVADGEGGITLKLFEATVPMRMGEAGRLVCTLPLIDLAVTPLAGDPDALELQLQGSSSRFKRIAEASGEPLDEAARLVGDYRCDEMEAAAAIRIENGEAWLVMSGPYGRDRFSLRRFAPLVWTSRLGDTGFGGVLQFGTDGDAVSGFALSTGRTIKLPFERVAG